MDLAALAEPIVQAPLAGGASTRWLAAAVSTAGGLGFLAAGYKAAEAVREDIAGLRSLTEAPFGLNVFAPLAPAPDFAVIGAYATERQGEAERYGADLGQPRHDDDLAAKLELACQERVPIVSFTFGYPQPRVVRKLHEAGCDVWVTVTNLDEGLEAQSVGADAPVVQGLEAGGHRAYFRDDPDADDLGLLAALRLIATASISRWLRRPGPRTARQWPRVLCAGAVAAQVGTSLMLSPEAGTSEPHRAALASPGSTRLTRAFSGR